MQTKYNYNIDPQSIYYSQHTQNPAKRLWIEVLKRAVIDAFAIDNSVTQQDKRSAKEWISNDSRSFRSYRWICELIDLPPSLIINALNQHVQNPQKVRLTVKKQGHKLQSKQLP